MAASTAKTPVIAGIWSGTAAPVLEVCAAPLDPELEAGPLFSVEVVDWHWYCPWMTGLLPPARFWKVLQVEEMSEVDARLQAPTTVEMDGRDALKTDVSGDHASRCNEDTHLEKLPSKSTAPPTYVSFGKLIDERAVRLTVRPPLTVLSCGNEMLVSMPQSRNAKSWPTVVRFGAW